MRVIVRQWDSVRVIVRRWDSVRVIVRRWDSVRHSPHLTGRDVLMGSENKIDSAPISICTLGLS